MKPNHRRPVTEAEDAIIRDMFARGCADAEIAAAIGRTINSATNRRHRLGLYTSMQAPKPGRRPDLWPRPRGFAADVTRWARRTFRPAEFRRDMTGDNGEAAMILAFLRDPAAKGAA